MTLEKEPFRAYTLEEERGVGEIISVRLNAQERAILNEIKEDLNIRADSKALKIGAFVGLNVLHSLFSRKILRYLFKKERSKLGDP